MRRIHLLLLLFILALAGCSRLRGGAVEADFLLEHVHVIPMNEEVVHHNRAVAIRDGHIVAIVDQADANRIAARRKVDGQGRYLMPGLADLHVHVRWDPQAMFNLFLANGVTTVVNMGLADGGDEVDHLRLRAAVADGSMMGPRYLVSGPQLHAEDLPDVQAVAPMLDRHVEASFDVVKIHGDLRPDVYEALMAGARERGLRVTGHAQHLMPLSATLQMDAMEHMEEFLYVSPDSHYAAAAAEDFLDAYRANVQRLEDPAHRARVVRAVSASGIFVNPTLLVYRSVAQWASREGLAAMADDPNLRYLPERVRARWLSTATNPYQAPDFPLSPEEIERNADLLGVLMRELHEAGVPLLLGTDAFGTLVPGVSLHEELELLVEAGLTPYEALRAGTVTVATYLGDSPERGTITEGKLADFVLLDANPLDDVKRAREVRGLFTHGRWYTESDLERLRAEARERIAASN